MNYTTNLTCENCSYAKAEFQRFFQYLKELATADKEKWTSQMQEIFLREAERSCYCDKVGGKIYRNGCCEEAIADEQKEDKPIRKENKSRHHKDWAYKNKLRKKSKKTFGGYNCHVVPIDKERDWNKDDVVYYKKLYKTRNNQKTKTINKKVQRKKVRYFTGELSDGAMYRKIK